MPWQIKYNRSLKIKTPKCADPPFPARYYFIGKFHETGARGKHRWWHAKNIIKAKMHFLNASLRAIQCIPNTPVASLEHHTRPATVKSYEIIKWHEQPCKHANNHANLQNAHNPNRQNQNDQEPYVRLMWTPTCNMQTNRHGWLCYAPQPTCNTSQGKNS